MKMGKVNIKFGYISGSCEIDPSMVGLRLETILEENPMVPFTTINDRMCEIDRYVQDIDACQPKWDSVLKCITDDMIVFEDFCYMTKIK